MAVPTAPSAFALSSKTDSTATFTWVDESSDETGFKIYNTADQPTLVQYLTNLEARLLVLNGSLASIELSLAALDGRITALEGA